MTRVFAVLIALMAPSAAVSEGWALAEDDMSFQRVTERDDFVSLMSQGTLNRMGMTLNVEPDGDITGKAFGRKISGNWAWRNGYFCRDLAWGRRDLGPNCQEVTFAGRFVRFTSDQGSGQYADLVLK